MRELHFFEPNPKLYQWAWSALSHLGYATGHQLALSDATGEATLHIPWNRSAYGSLEKRDQGDTDKVTVMMTTGDELVFDQGFHAPNVIKIDTEGHEIHVLSGMRRLIGEYRPVVFFEHLEIPDREIAGMIPAGYSLRTVANPNGRLTESFDRHAGHNSVLIPNEHPFMTAPSVWKMAEAGL